MRANPTTRAGVREPRDTTVRPRPVWIGMALAILGVVLAGVGVMLLNGWWGWGGGAIVLAGLVLAWRGGVLYDTRGQEPPHHEVREVRHGGEHVGVSPEAQVVVPGAEATAKAVTRSKEELLAEAVTSPPPSLRRLAAFGVLVLGAWLFLDQWFLSYPFSATGQTGALRDTGFAVVLVLCALRLRLRSPSTATSALVVLVGVLLALAGALLRHGSALTRWNEGVSGVLVLCLGALTAVARR